MSEQSLKNIYYLGPDGSNAHNAMIKFIEKSGLIIENQIPQKSIKATLNQIQEDDNAICVLPIENSIEGIVRETIDNLLKVQNPDIQILGEITLPIKHMLLSKTTDKKQVKKIYSHPQALAQCSKFLYDNYLNAELKEVSSTSYAAQKIAESDDLTIAAIANETCAKLFNLNILEPDINDEPDNKTRFYILGRKVLNKADDGKTALVLSTKNHSGALCDVLNIISKHKINLTYIDSRPSKKKLGEYLFFMVLDGLKEDERVKNALEELTSFVDFIKILGSFGIYE